MRSVIPILLVLFTGICAFAQTYKNNPWQDVAEKSFTTTDAVRRIVPEKYRTLSLDLEAMHGMLSQVPLRFSKTASSAMPSLDLPMPQGAFQAFRIVEAPVMHPDLAAKFPYMRSFAGWSDEDPTAYLRCGITQKGFHAMILSALHSPVFIDAYALGDSLHYSCYFKKDFSSGESFHCELDDAPLNKSLPPAGESSTTLVTGDCNLRTYSMALACTGEYAQFHGGTVPLVMAEFNEAVTRINGIYERELGVTFQLVPNNNLLVFLNANTDPYDNFNNSAMISQNQTVCDNTIGFPNYDIGHVFATGGGGLAYLQAVCGSVKAGGVSARSNPAGDPFWVDYVCHEIGHQFGGHHTQNNDCNRTMATAMETGSGVTIMGYAGVCAPNVQNNSIDNFHAISLDEMSAFIVTGNGNTCATTTFTGNQPPTVTVPATNYFIPKSTPFALTATGSDPDGNSLTYTWDQMDAQVATQPPQSTNTGGPAFRCFSPSASPTRYFPNLTAIVNNTTPTWEVLPSVGRTMNFRCTVRDNFAGAGCSDEVDVTLSVSNGAGPFLVTEPNTSSVTWVAGAMHTVTWSVANTNNSPVNCSQVEILLSTDGGFTYPYVLSSGTGNGGSDTVMIPANIANTTTQARVLVKGKGNVFFDISNQNFTITAPPSFLLETSPQSVPACLTGEALYSLALQQISGYDQAVSFVTSGLPAGATAIFTPASVAPPANVQLSISNLENVAAGTYDLIITGTSGAIVRTDTVELVVYDSLQTAVSLSTPSNGASGLVFNPVLTWQNLPDATAYLVEISKNPSFSLLVESTTVDMNSYKPSFANEPEGVYYWRVTGLNPCNTGPGSAVFAFQTGGEACSTFEASTLPLTIPSNQATTVSTTINVPDNFTVSRVGTHLEIDHTWLGDLSAGLFSPDGLEVTLFDQPGVPASQYGCSNDDMVVSFSDDASQPALALELICDPTPPSIDGTFQPVDPLNHFTGTGSAGNWTLSISDNFNEDGGALTVWTLELCQSLLPETAFLIHNEPLTVPHGQTGQITNTYLQADSGQGDATFTLLGLPQHGTLAMNQSTLSVGDVFTQTDIDSGLISYQHNGGTSGSDQFQFDLLTSNHNWLHGQLFMIEIIQNTLVVTASLTADIDCHNANNGTITVTTNGGMAPLEYRLNGGAFQGNNVFTNLGPGTYTAEVKDADGFTATTSSVTITNPPALTATATVNNNVVTVMANGGTGSLQFSLDGTSFQAGNVFSNLPNGVYTITVKDANGCTETTTATVAVNTLIVTAAITQQISCFGENDGQITVTASGGIPPFQYSLNNGTFQSNHVFGNLAPGTYTVQVKDMDGFIQSTLPVTMVNPPQLTGTATVTGYTITVMATGGTGPLQYKLDGGSFQGNNAFFPVPGGSHLIVIRDANSCEFSIPVIVSVAALSINAAITVPLPCWNSTNGEITATPGGGVPPYQYSLNGGSFQGSNVFSNLAAGTYTVTIKDSGGFNSTTAAVAVVAPPVLTVTPVVTGNTVTLTVSGGTASFLYKLDGGNYQPSNVFTNIPNGTHTATVKDANGCEKTVTFSISVLPPQISVLLTQGVSCHNGSDAIITVNASGGIPSYLYSLNGGTPQTGNVFTGLPAGNYTVVVTDIAGATATAPVIIITNPSLLVVSANAFGMTITAVAGGGTGSLAYSLDGVNFQTSPVFEGMTNGTYTITVMDENGCTAQTNLNVNAPVAILLSVNQPGCHDALNAMITIQGVDGGIPPYQYSLNGGLFTSNLVYSNLGPGDYTLTVQDATGYQFEENPVQIIAPDPILIQPVVSDDTLTINATGQLQYSIDGGMTFQAGSVFPNLPDGAYLVVVMDENGCTEEISITSVMTPSGLLSFEVFPNPGNGLFVIKTNLTNKVYLQIKVYDLAGRLVFQEKTAVAGPVDKSLDLRHLANGSYQLRLSDGEKYGTKRLVIIR